MSLHLIAARARNNVIGNGPDIPWQAKGEQKLFKQLTMNSVLIMGRKTYESIGRPLPGRTTIIVTRRSDYQVEGCITATSLEAAIELAKRENKPVFIAGGGEIYRQAISMVTDLHLTTIDVSPPGDVFFPEFSENDFKLVTETAYETNLKYTYQHLRRG